MVGAASDNIVANYETPIQLRHANIVGMNSYNVLAPYQPDALDIWGRGIRRYCVDEFSSPDQLNAHEQVTGAYIFAYTIIRTMPETVPAMTEIMENFLGLPMSNLYIEPPDMGTPWGLVKVMVDEMINYMDTDGWNSDGSLTRRVNKLRYEEFEYTDENDNTYIPYEPTRNKLPKEKKGSERKGLGKQKGSEKEEKCQTPDPWNWEPLQDSNDFGFFCKQEHVTPHIGFTGRLLGLSEEEYESFSSPLPDYDWCEQEADFAVERTRNMATSDTQKMEVEFFDNKFFSLLPLQINW